MEYDFKNLEEEFLVREEIHSFEREAFSLMPTMVNTQVVRVWRKGHTSAK